MVNFLFSYLCCIKEFRVNPFGNFSNSIFPKYPNITEAARNGNPYDQNTPAGPLSKPNLPMNNNPNTHNQELAALVATNQVGADLPDTQNPCVVVLYLLSILAVAVIVNARYKIKQIHRGSIFCKIPIAII